jgi:three-Cys-motif partner protein
MVDIEWLKRHLQRLLPMSDQLSSIRPEVIYEKGGWAALKLVCLMFYGDVYTKIISKSKHYDNMIYIDLLAGSGINRVKETGDLLIGSPIIAATMERPFDRLVFVEAGVDRSEALECRLSSVLDKSVFTVYNKKCDESIDEIIDENLSGGRCHYLAFVDCERLNVAWDTVEKLLQYDGDFIFNFQTSEINRVLGAYRKGKVYDETMYNFFGDVDLSQARSGVDLLREYKNNLKKHRDIVEDITIKGGGKFGNFYYDLIFATKRTKNGSPWFFKSVMPLKSRIEAHSGEAVQMALDILTGRQMTLDWFISEDGEHDPHQRELSDF